MPRRVLVTGGAGFIGSHLLERLVAAGDSSHVVDDLSRGHRSWLPAAAELHELDLRDTEGLKDVVRKTAPEVVVHLAAMHFIPAVEGAPELAWDVNVEGTRSLLAALASSPPRLLLFASTAAIYPDRAGPIDESCEPGPIDLYGETKLEGERLVAEFAARRGSRRIVARIFNVVGTRETNAHVVVELVAQLHGGNGVVRLGNLESRRDYTDVRDVSAGLHRLLSAPEGVDVFNLGSGQSVSVSELVQLCEGILGRAIEVEVEQRKLRPQDRAELVADTRRLRELTGWRPERRLGDTLAELLAEPRTR